MRDSSNRDNSGRGSSRLYRSDSLDDIHVTIPMDERHTSRVRRLWKERFGASDEGVTKWIDAATDEDNDATEGFVASSGGYTLGFGISCFSDSEYANEYINHPGVSITAWPQTAILHMLCVEQASEGQGIATELVRAQLRWMSMADCDGVVAVSWHRENYRDSRPIFEKCGFNAAVVAADFYETASGRVHCVDCDGGCKCGATVFKRALPTGGETHV